ncbi:MAG: hypothetical protein U0640_01420 [Phycisphaerales bacterium]
MNSSLLKHFPILASFGLGCVVAALWGHADASPRAFAAELPAGQSTTSNRVVAGDPVSVGKTWTALNKDLYMHFQKATNFDNAADCSQAGFRAVCGPNANTAEQVNVKLVQSPRSIAGEEIDLALESDSGYAAVWGWRPYVRLRRISAAAEGSWIIVQAVPGDPNTDRVILAYTEASKKVSIWRNDQAADSQPIATLEGDMMFVDVTNINGTYKVSDPKPVSSNAKVQEVVDWVRGKMK